jgi:hypothetical protein
MCDRFPCITRSIISTPTNFTQSRLHLVIINLTVKILYFFSLNQIKVGSFCFSAPVKSVGCGGLLGITRYRDMDDFHRHYLFQRDPSECRYNLPSTTGCVLTIHALLQPKSVCHSPGFLTVLPKKHTKIFYLPRKDWGNT